MRCVILAGLSGAGLLLASCSSVTEGSSQNLTFQTNPPGADCVLTRNGLTIGRTVTPGSVQIQKARADIEVACRKEGFEEAKGVVKYDMAASTLGNILIGGLIGVMVDTATNANVKYDPVTAIALAPSAGGRAIGAATPAPAPSAPAASAPAVTSAEAMTLPRMKRSKEALWKISEPMLLRHFEDNRLQYGSYLDTRNPHTMQLHRMLLVDGFETDGAFELVVRVEGQGAKSGISGPASLWRDFHFRMREQGQVVSVEDWRAQRR